MRGPRSRWLGFLKWIGASASVLTLLYLLAAYGVLPLLWRHYEHQPGLAEKPMITTTAQGIPGDPINVGLVGAKEQIIRAFTMAGWDPADAITVRSSIEIGASVLLDRPYLDAPVSTLLFEGRRQDLAFEKPIGNSADRRHHIRLWLTLETGMEGRPVWLGSASLDRSVGISHDTGQITHHIAPDVDSERDLVIHDLAEAKVLLSTYQVSGSGPTLTGRNGGGDRYYTDGEVTVGVINPKADVEKVTPRMLPNPPAVALKQHFWSLGLKYFHVLHVRD